MLKSLTNTIVIKKTIKLTKKHPVLFSLLLFSLIVTAVSLIFFIRFPNNFLNPNFYAEDGKDYMANILNNGFLVSIFHTFNGYFIVGMYLLMGMAYLINFILFQNQFVYLPASIAIVSYIFLAFCVCLPAFLLKKELGVIWATVLIIATAFVPLISSDYAIIGSIANLKWVFYYLGFCLIIYRIYRYKADVRTIALVDIGILICAYSNITVYLLYPLIFIPTIRDIYKSSNVMRALKGTLKTPQVVSALLLGILLLPQVIYIKINGIPKLPGYLDTQYEVSKTTELFVWRTYLYGIFYPYLHFFTDKISLIIMFIAASFMFVRSSKINRWIFLSGLYAAFIATFLFTVNRPGVSQIFTRYTSSGPDQFFYAQNMIIILVLIIVLAQSKMEKPIELLLTGLIIIYIVASLPYSGTFGKNDFMHRDVGTIVENTQKACENSKNDTISVQVYPIQDPYWSITTDRAYVCRGEK